MTLASMASVLANAADDDKIQFVILHNGLDDEHLLAFAKLQSIKSYALTSIKVDCAVFEGFPNANWVTAEAWFRCWLICCQTIRKCYILTVIRLYVRPFRSCLRLIWERTLRA